MILSCLSPMRKACIEDCRRAGSMSSIADILSGKMLPKSTEDWRATLSRAVTPNFNKVILSGTTHRSSGSWSFITTSGNHYRPAYQLKDLRVREGASMKTAKELLQAYINGSALESAALFADKGALELPY